MSERRKLLRRLGGNKVRGLVPLPVLLSAVPAPTPVDVVVLERASRWQGDELEQLRAKLARAEATCDMLARLNFGYLEQAEFTGRRWAVAMLRRMADHGGEHAGSAKLAGELAANFLEALMREHQGKPPLGDSLGIRARCRRLAWDWLRRAGDDGMNTRIQGMKDAHYELIELVGLGDEKESALILDLRRAVKGAASELRLAAEFLEEEEGKEEADGTREMASDLEAALEAFALPPERG